MVYACDLETRQDFNRGRWLSRNVKRTDKISRESRRVMWEKQPRRDHEFTDNYHAAMVPSFGPGFSRIFFIS